MHDMKYSVRDHARGHLTTSQGRCRYVNKGRSQLCARALLHLRLTSLRLHELGPDGLANRDTRSSERAIWCLRVALPVINTAGSAHPRYGNAAIRFVS